MPKIFADTNVILEHVLKRTNAQEAIDLFKLAEDGKVDCFCSSASFYTLCYVLKKHLSEKEVRTALRKYLTFISVIPADGIQLSSALASSFKDIEDAFQYFTALDKVSYFVTFNKKNFPIHSLAHLNVYTPKEILKLLA